MARLYTVPEAERWAKTLGWRVEWANGGGERKFYTPNAGIVLTQSPGSKNKYVTARLAVQLDRERKRQGLEGPKKKKDPKDSASKAVLRELRDRETKAYGEGRRDQKTHMARVIAKAFEPLVFNEEDYGMSADWDLYHVEMNLVDSRCTVEREGFKLLELNGETNPDEWAERAETVLRIDYFERIAIGEIS